jgi:hypothetical protein
MQMSDGDLVEQFDLVECDSTTCVADPVGTSNYYIRC